MGLGVSEIHTKLSPGPTACASTELLTVVGYATDVIMHAAGEAARRGWDARAGETKKRHGSEASV